MIVILVTFWTMVIFGSIAWYALLLLYIGFKGGREIVAMIRGFSKRDHDQPR